MRFTAICLSLPLLIAAGGAQAQKATSSDSQTIAQCLKKAQDQGSFGSGCIGIVADSCIKATREKKTHFEDAKACSARELVVWNALAADALKCTNASADAKIKSALAEAQKSFAQSQDKLCPLFDNLDPGSAPGGTNYCRLQETAHRTLALRRLADAVGEH